MISRGSSNVHEMSEALILWMNNTFPKNGVNFTSDNVMELRNSHKVNDDELEEMIKFFRRHGPILP